LRWPFGGPQAPWQALVDAGSCFQPPEDEGLSVWNVDEGFPRVRFKNGFSKELMRIENGPRFFQYSLLLCPPDI
jgi:hypothetical protein